MAARTKIHRNVTIYRLAADFVQFIRCQRPVIRRLGRPFRRSLRFVEMDITYRCNLRCGNCNRSCTQAPSDRELSVQDVADFLAQSREQGARWDRIRLLGGEPTLHKNFLEIVDLLLAHRAAGRPNPRIVVCTNGAGRKVQRVLDSLPDGVVVKNTSKNSRQRLFRPFNKAPIDAPLPHRFSDFSAGCRILEDCGIGLTPLGYYPCAIAGGIDRVFGFNLGRRHLPSPDDDMRDLLSVFCPPLRSFRRFGIHEKGEAVAHMGSRLRQLSIRNHGGPNAPMKTRSPLHPWPTLRSEKGPDLAIFKLRYDHVRNPRNGVAMRAVVPVEPNSAFQNNRAHQWVAWDVQRTHDLALDAGEDIRVRRLSFNAVRQAIQAGVIANSLALLALSRVFNLWDASQSNVSPFDALFSSEDETPSPAP